MGAIVGAIAGGQKDKVSQETKSAQESWLEVSAAGADEKSARATSLESLNSLDSRLKSIESSPLLARLDTLLMEMGSGPTAERLASATKFANDAFAPQQNELNQAFEDQTTSYAQRAAQMGRSSADPILAAKLAQEQVRQQARLSSEKTAFAANESINAPAREFGNLMTGYSGLSNQAAQNRAAVFSLGSEFANNQQQYRLATAKQYGNGVEASNKYSGGGFKGAVAGFNAGAGGDAQIASYALGMSDRNEKKNIREAKAKIRKLFLTAKPFAYEYKDEANGTGEHISPMAQDLESTELGKSLVVNSSSGAKIVNYGKALGLMFAGISELMASMEKIEARLGA
jgi:hypothetical protein